MPTRDDALRLAAAGWPVLPLRGKIPLTAHGVKDATTDPASIERWWPGSAHHNIGARVPHSLLVLDIDPQNGGSLAALTEAVGGDLPRTLTVHSGRGTGGRHLYFLHPGGQVSSTRLPGGIDVKTERGYCVMPPSLHPATGQPYRWEHATPALMPAKLVALLRPAECRSRPLSASRAGPGQLSKRAAHLAKTVQDAPEGKRNDLLYWATCQAVRDGHDAMAFELLEGAAIVAGLSETEAQRTVASARRTMGQKS
ncbi:bifunctional DNA primase/polymerase [Salinibacterium hongtaonis]|uniref:bifunctional DNA primase/polymerase n=1 Tax=Homoserinimonas hongtaonis TaxID=2079791 RepID=UPI000D3D4222|nr:bifunctional DNA primase/polymerase [Salinibacterium hongtaonis]AWB90306.1 DNA primase [Salinibacterium hongtaonis]